jgi:hypothetical protein
VSKDSNGLGGNRFVVSDSSSAFSVECASEEECLEWIRVVEKQIHRVEEGKLRRDRIEAKSTLSGPFKFLVAYSDEIQRNNSLSAESAKKRLMQWQKVFLIDSQVLDNFQSRSDSDG